MPRVIIFSAFIVTSALPITALAQTSADAAVSATAAVEKPWIVWNQNDFFGTCNNDCGIAVYGGREVTEAMSKIFVTSPNFPWRWDYGNGGVIAGTLSRRLVTLWQGLDIEPEIGVAQPFGNLHATEGWLALQIRWTIFPWNDSVRTTIALVDGLNFATKVDAEERLRSTPGHHGSVVLNNFTVEASFAAPSHPNYEFIFRFQHRSGAYTLFNGVYGGAQFATIGVRYRF